MLLLIFFSLVCFKGACINLFEVLCPVSLSCGGPDSDSLIGPRGHTIY